MKPGTRPILYHDPTSEPCRAVHWLAVEAGIDIDIEYTWLTRGEHREPSFLAVNPLHQVPAMMHGDFRLAEASAIMRYLVDLDGSSDRWIGATPRARARTNQLLSWHHTNTRTRLTLDYFLPVLLMPAYFAAPPPDDAAHRRAECRASLERLESLLREGDPYLGGAQPSLADLYIASDLFALDIDPDRTELFGGLRKISAWLECLRKTHGYTVSHGPWNAIVPRLRELLTSGDVTPRDCSWVADACLAAIKG